MFKHKTAMHHFFKRRGLVGALTTGLLLSGCAMGPDYERPELELPPQYFDELAQESANNLERTVSKLIFFDKAWVINTCKSGSK